MFKYHPMKYTCTLLVLLAGSISLVCCKKFEENLDEKNKDSGIVRIDKIEGDMFSSAFKIDERIAVVTKIGVPSAELKFQIGGVNVTPESHESRSEKIASYHPGDSITLAMEVYYFTIPRGAKLGPTNINFIINGQQRPPFSIDIRKPDILYPGKVTVEPFVKSILTPWNSGQIDAPRWPIDGPLGSAGLGRMTDLTYDADTRTWYFLDAFSADTSSYPSPPGYRYFLRKLQNGVVTTMAGAGTDPMATDAANKKLGQVYTMCAGPDKQLYLGVEEFYPLPDDPNQYYNSHQIIRIDPVTGKITRVAGGAPNGPNSQGIRDGKKEEALLFSVNSISFDKQGNLYFLDGYSLLRKVAPDGMVSTILGKADLLFSMEYPDPFTGEMVMWDYYSPVSTHMDGFADEVRLQSATRIAIAGNGKLYILETANVEYGDNIREVNLDTKETSTIVGFPVNVHSFIYSGTFKEVELRDSKSFDVDFDGNLLISSFYLTSEGGKIYKMDLQQETITLIAGGGNDCGTPLSVPKPGNQVCFSFCDRIVFDQFGNLYVADGSVVPMKKITIER